jgi:hypothetical protein
MEVLEFISFSTIAHAPERRRRWPLLPFLGDDATVRRELAATRSSHPDSVEDMEVFKVPFPSLAPLLPLTAICSSFLIWLSHTGASVTAMW